MKKIATLAEALLFLVAITSALPAQIPNPGFENWANGVLDGWMAMSNMLGFAPVTKSTDVHSGTGAARGEVISAYGSPLSPILIAGSLASGVPSATRAGSLTGFYKFTPVASSGDKFEVTVFMYKTNWLTGAIGAGCLNISAAASSYSQFTVPITYSTNEIPDSAYIMITIGVGTDGKIHIGSYFIVDDISFGPATGVRGHDGNRPAIFKLYPSYPNPFNPSTTISFSVPSNGRAVLKVYNVMGQELATLFSQPVSGGSIYSGSFDGTGLSSGIYLSRLQFISTTGEVMQSVAKMVLTK